MVPTKFRDQPEPAENSPTVAKEEGKQQKQGAESLQAADMEQFRRLSNAYEQQIKETELYKYQSAVYRAQLQDVDHYWRQLTAYNEQKCKEEKKSSRALSVDRETQFEEIRQQEKKESRELKAEELEQVVKNRRRSQVLVDSIDYSTPTMTPPVQIAKPCVTVSKVCFTKWYLSHSNIYSKRLKSVGFYCSAKCSSNVNYLAMVYNA